MPFLIWLLQNVVFGNIIIIILRLRFYQTKQKLCVKYVYLKKK